MHFGWKNSVELQDFEELIRNKHGFTDTERPDGWFRSIASQLMELNDELSVELTRMCMVNLAARHSGVDFDKAVLVSDEGLKHSLLRILELLRESTRDEHESD